MTPANHARWLKWMRRQKDFVGEALPCSAPTQAAPGTFAKVLELAARYERREALWHEQDAPEGERIGFTPATCGSDMMNRLATLMETCQGTQVIEERDVPAPRRRRPSELRQRTEGERAREAARKRRGTGAEAGGAAGPGRGEGRPPPVRVGVHHVHGGCYGTGHGEGPQAFGRRLGLHRLYRVDRRADLRESGDPVGEEPQVSGYAGPARSSAVRGGSGSWCWSSAPGRVRENPVASRPYFRKL